ncbi:MAG: tripartite tricarboxylate transporter substrate binding protein [Betaproteobacteria bacterium]|nr:tripartite tricarboxylate transporter substrate binding protein [Betaproteobacteria bacterium]
MNRRTLIAALAASLPALATSPRALADTLSARPVRIVVPFGAGGIADLTVRAVAQAMGEQLKTQIVIENKPGAGGIAAGETVARAAPDGHTLLLMSNGNAVSVNLFKSLPFDTVRDFAPICGLGSFGLGIVVPANSPHRTLAELLAHARANPGKLNLGTINIGSTQNLAGELFRTRAGINAQIIPFNGTPALLTALRGGHVDAGVEILGPLKSQLNPGGVRLLAVTSRRRAAEFPDVPTAAEAGVADYEASSWNALAAPARTPQPIIAQLNQAARAALDSPDVRKRFAELGVESIGGTPQALAELLSGEIRRWGDVIERAGIPKQ